MIQIQIIRLWILIVACISSSESWILPIKLIEPFHPISPRQVVCPRSREAPSDKANGLILLKLETLKNVHPEIKGYICSKMTLISRCDTTALFFTSKTKIAKLSRPTVNECLEALIRRKSGIIDLPLIDPPHICSWTGIQDETNSQVTIVDKKVFYDPYHNKLMSIIFPNHECLNDEYCTTIKDHELWIPEERNKHYCEFIRSSGTIIYDIGFPMTGVITHTIHYGNTISKSCWIDMCGRRGIRLEDQSWISIIDPSNTTSSIISNIQECSSESAVQNTRSESRLTTREEILILYHQICQMKLHQLKNVTKLHSNDLSFLSPLTPGKHPIYLFRKGLILKGWGIYDFIRTSDKTLYDTTHDIKDLWEQINNTALLHLGPNGFYSINNTLHISGDESDYNLMSELMGSYKMEVITRDVQLEILSERFSDDEITLETHDEIHAKTEDILMDIGDFFGDIFSSGLSLLYKVIIILGLILFGMILVPIILRNLICWITKFGFMKTGYGQHHRLNQDALEDLELNRLDSRERRYNSSLIPLN